MYKRKKIFKVLSMLLLIIALSFSIYQIFINRELKGFSEKGQITEAKILKRKEKKVFRGKRWETQFRLKVSFFTEKDSANSLHLGKLIFASTHQYISKKEFHELKKQKTAKICYLKSDPEKVILYRSLKRLQKNRKRQWYLYAGLFLSGLLFAGLSIKISK